MTTTTWILLADESVARIIEARSLSDFREIGRIEHPAGRLHDGELVSDRPGRSYDSFSSTRHAIAAKTTATEIEAQLFAREIANFLERAHAEKRVQRIYLVASPNFLGLLRAQLHPSVESVVVESVGKELTTIHPEEIKNHIYITFGIGS
jgi:protein required for attachment to host cells